MLTWVPGTSQHQCRSLPALWEKCKQYSPAEHLCVSALALSPTAAHTLKPCALPARPSPLTACLSFGHLPAPGSAMANLRGAAGRTPLRQAPPGIGRAPRRASRPPSPLRRPWVPPCHGNCHWTVTASMPRAHRRGPADTNGKPLLWRGHRRPHIASEATTGGTRGAGPRIRRTATSERRS